MQRDDDAPHDSPPDRRQVTLDDETFDALEQRVDAPGEWRAGTADLFDRRKALDELVSISEELGLYDLSLLDQGRRARQGE